MSFHTNSWRTLVVAVIFVPTTTSAQGVAPSTTRSQATQAHDVRQIPPSAHGGRLGIVLRQDLFDRNNLNNLRSDYPAPPAQPGQF